MSTILIVEDTLTDLQVVSGSLQQAGYAVVTAANEQEAKTRLAQHKPDLIVLDVVLPDRSGFEICRDLKEQTETKDIPVVICSTKGSNMDKYWGMQQGADAYLAKPVDPDELVKIVRKLV
uniref:Response regulator receiver protein n=1 Tax=Cyanothece sp. (strain PCC 7425 / ATCC 29141) TaxID=395961 RepID=B8HNR5_CYAP4